jgi:hypothetical protein
MEVGRGANNPTLQKKKIVEKPPRNSAGFCGGCQGLSWAVEPRKEERIGLRMHNMERDKLIQYAEIMILLRKKDYTVF